MIYSLIPFLPLLAFLIVGIGEQWIKDRAHLVAVPAVIGSFLLSLMALTEAAALRRFMGAGGWRAPEAAGKLGLCFDRTSAA